MDHGQQAGQHPAPPKVALLALEHRPVQQVQQGEQHPPAKEQRPLGQHHVHHHVYPADVFLRQVGGGLVKLCKDAGKVFPPAAEEIYESQAAVEEEQSPGEKALVPAAQQPGGEQQKAEDHLAHGEPHGQGVGKIQRRAHQVQRGRHAVPQKGVGQPGPRQNGVLRGEFPLPGQAGDKAQVHARVPVGGLAGVDAPVLEEEGFPHQKAGEAPQGHSRPQGLPAAEGEERLPQARPPPGEAPAKSPAGQGQRQRPQVGGQGEAQEKGAHHREPLEHHRAGHAAQQQPCAAALPGQGEAGHSHAAALKSPEQRQGGQSSPKAPLHGVSLLSVCTYPTIFSQKCKVADQGKIGYNGRKPRGECCIWKRWSAGTR